MNIHLPNHAAMALPCTVLDNRIPKHRTWLHKTTYVHIDTLYVNMIFSKKNAMFPFKKPEEGIFHVLTCILCFGNLCCGTDTLSADLKNISAAVFESNTSCLGISRLPNAIPTTAVM